MHGSPARASSSSVRSRLRGETESLSPGRKVIRVPHLVVPVRACACRALGRPWVSRTAHTLVTARQHCHGHGTTTVHTLCYREEFYEWIVAISYMRGAWSASCPPTNAAEYTEPRGRTRDDPRLARAKVKRHGDTCTRNRPCRTVGTGVCGDLHRVSKSQPSSCSLAHWPRRPAWYSRSPVHGPQPSLPRSSAPTAACARAPLELHR